MPTVKYRRLKNLGNYENESLELEDELQPGETKQEAYMRVRAEVLTLLSLADPLRDLDARIRRAEARATEAEMRDHTARKQWNEAANRYDELRDLLARHGAEIEPLPAYLRPPAAPAPAAQISEEEDEEEDRVSAF